MVLKKTSKKAIFFLRHNNDIDHMVPVIYKWLATEKIPTDVIITTKKSLLEDYRINYLKQFEHVKIFHINDLFKKNSLPYLFNRFYFKDDTRYDSYFKRFSFIKKRADNAIKRIAEKIYNGSEKAIIVFDWIQTYFTLEMVKIAKNKGFTTISLPHGDRPYVSLLETIDELSYDELKSYEDSKVFDYVVVPNKLNTERYEQFIKPDRLKVLGSPRYCDEWMKINSKFIPPFDVKESKGKLKIVFFLRNLGYPIFWDEVVRTIRLIMQFDEVYLIVKHHPRNSNAKRLTEQLVSKYPELNNMIDKNLKFMYEGMNSGSLLNWADLIIDLGTSVTWEAVKMQKPVFMIEYLYANHSTIAYYIKNSEIKSRDDLYHGLEKLIKNKKMKFYNEAEKRRFIKEIIDVPDKFVLERYVKFLKSCLEVKK